MQKNIFTEALADKLGKIKSILKFRPKRKLKNTWGMALGKETSLGCWWYELKAGGVEYSRQVRMHNTPVFSHVWKDLKYRRWIRGHIFQINNQIGVLIHIEDFLDKDASGSVLAAMVRKVTEVTGYPVCMVADEQGRLWAKV